jgi:hypothetical protein
VLPDTGASTIRTPCAPATRASSSASAAPTLLICNQMVFSGQWSSNGSTTSRMMSAVGHGDPHSGGAHHLTGPLSRLTNLALEPTKTLGFTVPGGDRDVPLEQPMGHG